jgi:hypothetical protein
VKEIREMEPGRYSDPLEDALSHSAQRVAQLASLAAAAGQVALQRKALHDALVAGPADSRATRSLRQQQQALRQEARMTWAAAHDPQWLARADLVQTARAWAGAVTFADSDPSASSAQRKCEQRLRLLHPYGMNYYDRLCSEGVAPHDAMSQAAPLFARPPTARPGDTEPARPALTEGTLGDMTEGAASSDHGEPRSELGQPQEAEERGQQIADQLQARARAAGRPLLGPAELALVLETVTNLPDDLITKISHRPGQHSQPGTRSATQVAAECFPHTVSAAFRNSAVLRPGSGGQQASARRTADAVAQGLSHRSDRLSPGGSP